MIGHDKGSWTARVGGILVVLGLIAGSGSEPLHSQDVGDRARVTAADGISVGRLAAVSPDSIELRLSDGRSLFFSSTEITRLERSRRAAKDGLIYGLAFASSLGLGMAESIVGPNDEDATVLAILSGGMGAAIGFFAREWEDIELGGKEAVASAGQRTLVGVRWGFGASSHSFSAPPDADYGIQPVEGGVARMHVGVDVAIPLRNAIELRIGGAYAPKGYGWNTYTDPYAETVETDYLQWSALARAGTPRGNGPSFGLLLGPWIAVALSCSHSGWNFIPALLTSGGSYERIQSRPCDEFKRLDMGLAVGANAGVPVPNSRRGLRLEVDVVYSFGLVTHPNLITPPDPHGFDYGTDRTRHLGVQTGIVIPVGG